MKRLLVIMFFLLLTIGLVACGGASYEAEESVTALGDIAPYYPQHLGSPVVPLEPPHNQADTPDTLIIIQELDNETEYLLDDQEPDEVEINEPAIEPAPQQEPESVIFRDEEVGILVNGQFIGKSWIGTMDIVEFTVTIRPGTDREDIRQYRGVAVADILEYFGINEGTSLVFHSFDGFASGITMAEALDRQQAFIAIWQDGQYFVQRGDYWSAAPFQLVMAQDIFAQRFARYITEIVVQ